MTPPASFKFEDKRDFTNRLCEKLKISVAQASKIYDFSPPISLEIITWWHTNQL
ncbi:MAG: hypothetical protein ACTSXP_03555 [Promethearchaeota archaeon]